MTIIELELHNLANPARAQIFQRFFKTGQGQYGEGDKFLGLTVPIVRQIAKKFATNANLDDISKLLESPFHECRLAGLLIMIYQYPKLDEKGKKEQYQFYLKNYERINNWDLVDVTAPKIVGAWLLDHPVDRKILTKLASSPNLWQRRIAVLSTYPLIKHGQFSEIIMLATMLMSDQQDLMHKAIGWMLREMGKKDIGVLVKFLDQNATKMPRTMLRYAIEKFEEPQRKYYLTKKP